MLGLNVSERAWLQAAAAARAQSVLRRVGLIVAAAAAWLLYFPVGGLLNPQVAVALQTPLDAAIPFVPGAEWVYAAAYPLALLPVLQIRDLDLLERYVKSFTLIQVLACAFFVLLPIRMVRPAGVDLGGSFIEWAVGLNYSLDSSTMKCFPSLHVANAFFAALVANHLDAVVGRIALGLALAVSLSTLLVKQHYLADLLGGGVLAWAAYRITMWRAQRPPAEARFPRSFLVGLPLIYLGMAAVAFLVYSQVPGTWPRN